MKQYLTNKDISLIDQKINTLYRSKDIALENIKQVIKLHHQITNGHYKQTVFELHDYNDDKLEIFFDEIINMYNLSKK